MAKAVRNIAPAKRLKPGTTPQAPLSIIIPAASPGKRMKSYGSRSLLPINNETPLLAEQIEVLQETFPCAEIVVITGFEADKVYKIIPTGVRIVENEQYESTGVSKSINMGLRASLSDNVLIVYGDVWFNYKCLDIVDSASSTALIDSDGQVSSEEVGITLDKKYIAHWSYGLPIKWGKMVYLNGIELELCKKFVYDRSKSRTYGFEAFNHIIENGGKIQALEPRGCKIHEIDAWKDVILARKKINS